MSLINTGIFHPLNHVDVSDSVRRVNLMAVFFDVLVVDELVLVHESYVNRTNILAKMISTEPGKVSLSPEKH